MEIRNLNTFLRVAALQNFTKASQELGYSQSNVSIQIKQLEAEVGVPLFDRIGKSVFLTPYGESLLPYAQQIVSTTAKMKYSLRLEGSMGGIVRIGMVDSLYELLLEDAFISYHRQYPLVQLEVVVDAAASLKHALRKGQIDVACLIDDPLPPAGWNVWDAVEVPIVAVVNPLHPLAHQTHVTVEEIPQHDLIVMEDSASYSIHFWSFLAAKKIEAHPFMKLQSADTARRLVEKGPFLSVLPLYTVYTSAQAGRLRILQIFGWEQKQAVQMVFHQSKVITAQMEAFLVELRAILGSALSEKL